MIWIYFHFRLLTLVSFINFHDRYYELNHYYKSTQTYFSIPISSFSLFFLFCLFSILILRIVFRIIVRFISSLLLWKRLQKLAKLNVLEQIYFLQRYILVQIYQSINKYSIPSFLPLLLYLKILFHVIAFWSVTLLQYPGKNCVFVYLLFLLFVFILISIFITLLTQFIGVHWCPSLLVFIFFFKDHFIHISTFSKIFFGKESILCTIYDWKK